MRYALLFLSAAALDFVWAAYIAAVAAKRPTASACWSTLIGLIGGSLTIQYIGDHWALLPVAAGFFAGTYICVRRG
jgi:hypothetical protein